MEYYGVKGTPLEFNEVRIEWLHTPMCDHWPKTVSDFKPITCVEFHEEVYVIVSLLIDLPIYYIC